MLLLSVLRTRWQFPTTRIKTKDSLYDNIVFTTHRRHHHVIIAKQRRTLP